MFIGRNKELNTLEEIYKKNSFNFVLLHGRRRIGKTSLLSEFSKKHIKNVIFFTAEKSSEEKNVLEFIKEIKKIIEVPSFIKLNNWNDVFEFINTLNLEEKLIIIIDEFTYLKHKDDSFDSKLQRAIDRYFSSKKIMLILSGSEISVIDDLINNYKAPLYGRKTNEIKLFPFRYFELKEFYPKLSNKEILEIYMVFGGTPLYLSMVNPKKSLKENILNLILDNTSLLFNEGETFLLTELNEPYLYKEILGVIGSKKVRLNDIATLVNEPSAKVAKYLLTLINLSIVKKTIPVEEKENSRNSLYYIEDNFFAFYYTFIYKSKDLINGLIDASFFYKTRLNDQFLSTFFGYRFENICITFLKKRNLENKNSFLLLELGSWWGNYIKNKKPIEIDILGNGEKKRLFGEIKYKNSLFDKNELEDLISSSLLPNFNDKDKEYIVFSKSGFSDYVIDFSKKEKLELIGLDDLL